MSEIIVKSQLDWDQIPDDFKGYIYIQSDTRIVVEKRKGCKVVARDNSSVLAYGDSSVVALENSSVVAWENSVVNAWDNSVVEARGNSSIVARGNSSVWALDNSVVKAWGNSSVEARDNSVVKAWDNSVVKAWDNSVVEARGNSSVVALENSSVVALDNSVVKAWDNSVVEARGNSSVWAWENSSVVAWENSVVKAWDNSVVEARGNVQVCKYSDFVSISTQGNARIVTLPKTLQEYCEFYGVTVKDGNAILYKAVSPTYSSFYDREFVYEPGEKKEVDCDPSTDRPCSHGMHVSHLLWALDYGRYYNEFKILECAVPLDKIVVPTNTDGKVRTSELTVLREVPPEEWGVFGKVLLAQMGKR